LFQRLQHQIVSNSIWLEFFKNFTKKTLFINILQIIARIKSDARATEDIDDDPEFLASEANNNGTLVHIEPADGEWSSFPEIHKKTKEILIAKGYKALFPI
jgi:hypothetical protein